MRITYNSPVILSFSFLTVLILVLNQISQGHIMPYFTVGGQMDWLNPISYFRLFSHILGHKDWNHLLGNTMFILLLGPILEEKYGAKKLLLMILLTGLVTGIIITFFSNSYVLGSSGIVFMLILLSSIVNAQRNTIPLTFILVASLYLGKELIDIFKENEVSQTAHIMGGICGAVFGFYGLKKGDRPVG